MDSVNKGVNGELSEDCFSDEEPKHCDGANDEIIKTDENVSTDAVFSHINEQFEGIDLLPKKSDETFQIPTDDLVDRIVQQVEYYFSDENIVRDDYLLKLIKQSKKQFVNLKIIAAFNKMKKLTKSCKVIAYSIEKASTKLVLDEKKVRVKRVDPLPEIPQKDFGDASKVVLATTLPSLSVESLSELFSKCGQVSKVKVVQTEAELPDAVKEIRGGLKIYTLPFALVEYNEASAASHASKSLTNNSDWRRGIRVEVLAKFATKVVSKDKENKMNANMDAQTRTKTQQQQQQKNKKKKKSQVNQVATNRPDSGSNPELERTSSPMGEKKGMPIPRPERGTGSPKHPSSLGSSPRTQAGRHLPLARSPLTTDLEEEMGSRIRSSSFGSPLSKGLWVPKRMLEASGQVGSTGQLESYKNTHVGVLRSPRIPDDTKGFTTRRTVS